MPYDGEEGARKLMAYVSRLHQYYTQEVVPALQRQFSYRNVMQVPRLDKIILNMGLGEAIQNPKMLDAGMEQLAVIAGQKPVITKAHKSIAAFKLRTGMSIGVKVTLRKDRMYDFFDRLVNIALPRVRDFRGVTGNAFDGRGNYTLGIEEQIIFPEVDYDKVEKIKGLAVTIVTTAETDMEGKELLRLLGMPFRN
jgi:large subunit ribosomal protein L5